MLPLHLVLLPQALLEFHMFPPPLPPGGVPALLRLFAPYWAAGVPRIGEEGARGWAYWCCWHAMGMEQPTAPAEQEAPEAEAQVRGWLRDTEGSQAWGTRKQTGMRLLCSSSRLVQMPSIEGGSCRLWLLGGPCGLCRLMHNVLSLCLAAARSSWLERVV